MQLKFTNSEKTLVGVMLVAGERLGNLAGPGEFSVAYVPGNRERDEIVARNFAVEDYAASALTPAETRDKAFADDLERVDLLARLQTATPTQIRAYVATNVTDLASARAMIMRILLILALLASR